MNPQDLEGFSYLDKDGQRITVLGPIGPDDARVQLEREDGKRWGCPVAHLTEFYEQHAAGCHRVLLSACEVILDGIEAREERLGWGREQMLREAVAKARCHEYKQH